MPKASNQKLKLLYLMRFLLRETDEENGASMEEILAWLEAQGISAERKSVYDDLETLQSFGLAVEKLPGRPPRYAVVSREFELPELKLLVDAVQVSRFITEKKSLELIRKLEALAGRRGAQALHRQVFVRNRAKTENETIYYNVDRLHEAITRDRAISFRYFNYTVEKKRAYRHEGERYLLSPLLLNWDDENYYLIGYDHKTQTTRHYRVDKMEDIRLEEQRRGPRELLDSLDPAQYAGQVFGMYNGELRKVRLRFASHLVGAVLDRFGQDPILAPDGDDAFTVTVEVMVSPQFYGWLCGFGAEVELLSPADVRAEYAEWLRGALGKYQGEND